MINDDNYCECASISSRNQKSTWGVCVMNKISSYFGGHSFLPVLMFAIAIFVICSLPLLVLSIDAFGQQSPEYQILCPPNDGVSSNGNYSDEPLKEDLKTGQITRLSSVERAIAEVACQHTSQISDIETSVEAIDQSLKEITCSDQIRNGDETDVDCGGSCPDKCETGDQCLVDSDCESGDCDGGSLTCQGP